MPAKKIAIVGLGKMGANFAAALIKKNYEVRGYDSNPATANALRSQFPIAADLVDLVRLHGSSGVYLLSLPAGKVTRSTIEQLLL